MPMGLAKSHAVACPRGHDKVSKDYLPHLLYCKESLGTFSSLFHQISTNVVGTAKV